MVVVHVRDGAGFGFEEVPGARDIGRDIRGAEISGASKAGIKMRGLDAHAPERKVGEAGIQFGLGMPCQKAPAQLRFVGRVMRDFCKTTKHGQPRMRQRIALPGDCQQHRSAAICFKIRGMAGQPRDQDHWRTIAVGCDIDK